jgi:methylthioribose-1-phosphate isomerase
MKVGERDYRTIWPGEDRESVLIIDQTRLPHAFVVLEVRAAAEMARAIRDMIVRGAPLIGAAAAYGLALGMREDASDASLARLATEFLATRPTAVNLRWAIARVSEVLRAAKPGERFELAWREAAAICDEDVEINRAIGDHGLAIVREYAAHRKGAPVNVLTHCNAGWLATVDWGTALAPIYAASRAGIDVHVWVDETRPRNQGASLTAWELAQEGIPFHVIVDNAGGHLMQHGMVDLVIVGCDRVTARGDVCNKIGTYLKALAAYDNGVPFYVALPSPTIDWAMSDGVAEIPIEQRDPREVTHMGGIDETGTFHTVRLTPVDVPAINYGFDVTPARLITGLVTERGVGDANRAALSLLFAHHRSFESSHLA